MSIAAGFRCGDGVVLCADTEHTVGETLKLSRAKLFRIPEAKGEEKYAIAVAGAGDADFMNMTIQKVGAEIGTKENRSIEVIKAVIEEKLLEVYGTHIRLDPSEPRLKPYFDLLVAVWTREGIEFFKTSSTAIARVERYECIGTGTALASYLLDTLSYDAMPLKYGLLLAVHVLKQTKKYVPYCGGENNIAILQDNGEIISLTTSDLLDKEMYLEVFEEVIRPLRYGAIDLEKTDEDLHKSVKEFSDRLDQVRSMEKEFSKFKGGRRYGDFKPFVNSLFLAILKSLDTAKKGGDKGN